MVAINQNLSDDGLKDQNYFKLSVRYPLFLKVYFKEAFEELVNSDMMNDSLEANLLDTTVFRNVTMDLITTEEEHYRLRQDFNMLLETKEFRKYNLTEDADTLLYTCLHFFAVHFSDTDYRTVSKRNDESNETYAASRQESLINVRELSSLFLTFNQAKNKNNIGNITIDINNTPFVISQPTLGRWIVEAIESKIRENDYPVGILGEHNFLLSQVLQKKGRDRSDDETDMLEDLKLLSKLGDHKYIGERNRMIRRFCLDVHKMFAFLINEDPEHFSNVQLRLYAHILKLFRVHDFTKGFPSKSVLANRLRSVIQASG